MESAFSNNQRHLSYFSHASKLNGILSRYDDQLRKLQVERERALELLDRNASRKLKSGDSTENSLCARINLGEVIVVAKKSKFQLDQDNLKKSPAQVIAWYEKEGANAKGIVESHERQQLALNRCKKLLSDSQVVGREDFLKLPLDKSRVVIALGGDNHFQWVTHHLGDRIVLPINSDPVTSDGGLIRYNASDLSRLLYLLERGEYNIQEWTRLEATLNGNKLPLVTSELFVGELERLDMSRGVICDERGEEKQKSSGLIIATGAGSSGWYNSAIRFIKPTGDQFPRTDREARYVNSEPFEGKLTRASKMHGVLQGDQTVQITSLNDHHGIVSTDCHERFDFPRGAKLVVRIASEPLKVVMFR